jgi:hypothetical protein
MLDRVVVGMFSLAFGLAFGAAGILLGAWTAVAVYRKGLAWEWMVWAIEHTTLPWTAAPQELANDMVNSRIPVGIGSLFLCWIAVRCLRSTRRALGPPGLSDDGWGRLDLEAAPRVGATLKGRVLLTKTANPGEVFRLCLTCERRPWAESKGTVTLFAAEQDVQVAPEGTYLPVEFHMPVTAPESAARQGDYVVEWRLKAYATSGLIAFPSVFDFKVAPPTAAEARALAATESPQDKVEIAAIERGLGGFGRRLLPHQRAQLRNMTPAERAQFRDVLDKTGKFSDKVGRFFLGCFVAVFAIVALLFLVGNLILMLK